MSFIKERSMGDFHITYEDLIEHHCLLLRFDGTYNANHSSTVLSDGLNIMKELGYECCIVDIRTAVYEMSVAEMYNRAELWDDIGVPRTLTIAHVISPDSIPQHLKFLENVLTNRGWKIKRFNSMEQALAWIDDNSDK